MRGPCAPARCPGAEIGTNFATNGTAARRAAPPSPARCRQGGRRLISDRVFGRNSAKTHPFRPVSAQAKASGCTESCPILRKTCPFRTISRRYLRCPHCPFCWHGAPRNTPGSPLRRNAAAARTRRFHHPGALKPRRRCGEKIFPVRHGGISSAPEFYFQCAGILFSVRQKYGTSAPWLFTARALL